VCSCLGLCLCCLACSAYWLSYVRCDIVLVLWYVYMDVCVCVLVCVYVCVCVFLFRRSCRSSIVFVRCLSPSCKTTARGNRGGNSLAGKLQSSQQGTRITYSKSFRRAWSKRSGRNMFTNRNFYGVDNAHYASCCFVVFVSIL
jgi:hypothetical protein